jgi:hypothetical protein
MLARQQLPPELKGSRARNAMLRNLDIAQKLGCLDVAGLGEMKRGKAPTVQKSP